MAYNELYTGYFANVKKYEEKDINKRCSLKLENILEDKNDE